MSHEVANLDMAAATRHLPVMHYAYCTDAADRPLNHRGDWPEEGTLYPIRVVPSRLEGMELVHVLNFEGEAPYYNAFGPQRFAVVAEVWLN